MTDELDTIIVVSIIMLILIVIIFKIIPNYVEEEREEKISDWCSHIFNPSTSLSNYTSYQHCIKYPETYGVDR